MLHNFYLHLNAKKLKAGRRGAGRARGAPVCAATGHAARSARGGRDHHRYGRRPGPRDRPPDRARRAALYIGLAVLAACVITLGAGAIWNVETLGLFSDEVDVIAEGARAYGVLGLGMLFYLVSLAFENALIGAGDTVSPMVINIVYLGVIQLPLVYALAQFTDLGSTGIWWTIAASRGARVAMSFGRFLQGGWQTKEI